MTINQSSDESLVSAFLTNDPDALNTLLTRYSPPVHAFLREQSRYKDASFIDDLLTEVTIAVIECLKQGRFTPGGPGSFKAWLYRLARNICYAQNRTYTRQPRPIDKSFIEVLPDDIAKNRPENLLEPTENQVLTDRINNVLSTLKPLDRQLFELRRDGLSYKQIKPMPEFSKFTLGRLRLKYFEITEKIRTGIK